MMHSRNDQVQMKKCAIANWAIGARYLSGPISDMSDVTMMSNETALPIIELNH